MGELHLEIIIDRLRREYGVDCQHRRAAGGLSRDHQASRTPKDLHAQEAVWRIGRDAEVKVQFEPTERNRGVVFENKVVGGSVPQEYIPAVEKGIRVQADTGVLAGFPTVTSSTPWWTASTTTSTRRALAFEIAAKACFREGMKKATPIILEPIMDVEVTTPQDHVGDVVGDLNRRRGRSRTRRAPAPP